MKDKDAVDLAAPAEGGYLIDDTKLKVLSIPAPDPGNIIGFEYEVEEQPFWLQDVWHFQGTDPVRESHYSLQLPPGWVFKAAWLSHDEVKPDEAKGSLIQWTVTDVKGIRPEPHMPPWAELASQMIVSFFPSETWQKDKFASWDGVGSWWGKLYRQQMDASEPIKQKVVGLTAGKATLLQKMQAMALFMQHDIRYVAIELGIGGWQPHAAPEVFAHKYGDCKDKATLMRTMLREIGVESYQVAINTKRGSVTGDTPAHNAFNHVILVIKLPDAVQDPSLIATIQHPKLGRLLFFDPTNEITPFGEIGGYLQANYGLLLRPEGGELVELPQQASATNGIQRTGKMTLDSSGTLKGEVSETRVGDRASAERWRQRSVTKDSDRKKPIEDLLAGSISIFQLTKLLP